MSANQLTWHVISAESGPGPRSRHCLVHDLGRHTTVLFGGVLWQDNGRFLTDTWELCDGRWSCVDAPRAPHAGHRAAMAYDRARGFSVLFGGQGKSSFLSLSTWRGFSAETWIYEDGRWRKLSFWSWRRPGPRCGHSLAYDEQTQVTVLFGGIDGNDRPLGDTWLFDGSWRRVRGPAPPPRRYAAFAYDPGLEGCVLHGGAADDQGRKLFADTWLFQDGGWTRLRHRFETDTRDDHGMAYHPRARKLILLEGINGARGLLGLTSAGWEPVEANPVHPRHQCSPLAWDGHVGGLVLHGGEKYHGGPQFASTLVLR